MEGVHYYKYLKWNRIQFSSLKIRSLRSLLSKYKDKFWGKPQNLVGICFTNELLGNFKIAVCVTLWLFLGIELSGTFWWCGNSGIGITLGRLEFFLFKKSFLVLVIKCLPVHLLTILLFGFLITMHKYQLKTCVRAPSLEPQINPLSPFCYVALAECAVLSRWCCYWNLSVMSILGSRSGICDTRGKSLLLGFTFEGEGLPGLRESWCGWHTMTGCLWEAGMDWLPRFQPDVWVFSKQEASVLLIQQPKHTDVCCFPRDHLVVTSKWLGG